MSTRVATGALAIAGQHETGAARGDVSPFTLVDLQARDVRYLRVSLTDRCNFRCTYCMPAEGVDVVDRPSLLRFEEIVRLVRVFVSMGVRRVRLTGGEPLTRRGVVDLVRRIAAVPGVEDLAMTTNGFLLPTLAKPLRDAGLQRLNLSLDTLDAARFARMTRQGDLATVLAGLDAARDAGFEAIKLNAVMLRGENAAEAPDLVRFARDEGHVLRFIEYMPIGTDDYWGPDTYISGQELRGVLGAAGWDVRPGASVAGGGPARYWTARHQSGGAGVSLGFITAVSDHFCATCNRVRLSPVGTLRECLSTAGALSLRDMIRQGADDDALRVAIDAALHGKVDGHRFTSGQQTRESMVFIGG